MLKYARFHLGDGTAEDGTRVLSAESLQAMQIPGTKAQLDTKMGISWMMADHDGPKRVFHGGGTFGQISAFILVPERKFAFVMLTNSWVLGDLMHDTDDPVREFLAMPYKIPQLIAMAPEALAEHEGRYVAALDDIELKVENGELMMNVTPKGGFPNKKVPAPPVPPPSKLGFITNERGCVVDGKRNEIQGEFLRGTDGKIAHFRVGGRIHPRQ